MQFTRNNDKLFGYFNYPMIISQQ